MKAILSQHHELEMEVQIVNKVLNIKISSRLNCFLILLLQSDSVSYSQTGKRDVGRPLKHGFKVGIPHQKKTLHSVKKKQVTTYNKIKRATRSIFVHGSTEVQAYNLKIRDT